MAVVYDMSRIDAMEGHEFEHFMADLLRKLGYQKVEVTPGSGDQGVDVLAEKDGVRYAIQCKCYSSDLGNTPVQEINTGKMIYRCHVGVVVTNRYFTQGAREAAKATGVLLWDRSKLESLIAQAQSISGEEVATQQSEDAFTLWTGSPLLRRGGIALKDKDWKKAHQFFDRVLNTDPENAEAYLGLVMAEAELSDEDDFMRTYINSPLQLSQLNQNNLRHAKEFGSKELRVWFRKLEEQQKDVEVRKEKEKLIKAQEKLIKIQRRNEEYKQAILSYLSANPELVVTPDSIMNKVLRAAYPGELWSNMKTKLLLNALDSEGILIRVKEQEDKRIGGRIYIVPAAFMLSEAERFRLKVQEDILAYLFLNAELAVTPHDIMERVLMPAYPDEQWSDMKAASLINALCDKESKLTRVQDKRGNDAFTISKEEYRKRKIEQQNLELQRKEEEAKAKAKAKAEAERKRKEEAEAERRRKEAEIEAERQRREAEERQRKAAEEAEAERKRLEEITRKKVAFEAEQSELQEELAGLKGLFTRRRRREIEARLTELKREIDTM